MITVKLCTLLVAFLLATPTLVAAGEDILIVDFEGDTYGQWKVAGEAFGTRPADHDRT